MNSVDLELKDEIDFIEHEMSNNLLNNGFNNNLESSTAMYLQEVGRYPMLSKEEEQELGQIIHSPNKSLLLSIKNVDNIEVYSLNKELLFSSLVDSNMYNSVIDSLLRLYSIIECHEMDTEEELMKYKRISNSLGRALNKDELKKYFSIEDNHYIEESKLLNEVKKYIAFKYSYNKFFVSNLRLVVSFAKKYYSNVDFLELVNEGNLGLLRAIQGYDPNLGYKFSTYAVSWIEQFIERAISKYSTVVRIPINFRQEISKFKANVELLKQEMKRDLTIDEISNKLKIPVKKINEYYTHMYEIVSLDKPIGEDGDSSILDMIAQDESIDEIISSKFLVDDINELLENITEREQEVIKLRYGIGNDSALTIEKIAKALSISPARVRQIETKALIKMRRLRNTEKIKSLQYYIK